MVRMMLFIDGDWLFDSIPRLTGNGTAGEFSLDYALLPRVLGAEAARLLGLDGVETVRSFICGREIAEEEANGGRRERFALLREDHHYEASLFPTERESAVALTAELFYHAAIPGAFDIAVLVSGDRDHLPALRLLRRLGKRVVFASIKDACDREYTEPAALTGAVDADPLWLDDILSRIELRAERHQLECLSPLHQGSRKVWTDYKPRNGRPFYCDECRRRFAEQHRGEEGRYARREPAAPLHELTGEALPGEICKVVREKGYGFIKGADGREFFFHLSDLTDIAWDTADTGLKVTFLVRREPEPGRAGAAGRVLRADDVSPEAAAAAPVEEAKPDEPVTL